MRTRRLPHLDDAALLARLRELVAHHRAATAQLLIHLGEVEARRLHAPAGHPSLFEYCVREFGWTRQTTFKRIGAARAARRFPPILTALEQGKLNVSGVILLRSYLTRENAAELLRAASGRPNTEIAVMLAERFPKPDVTTRITAASKPETQLSARIVAPSANTLELGHVPQVEVRSDSRPQALVERPVPPPRLTPLAPERFALQVTIAGDTHALLRRAQELLSHQNQSGDVAQVLHRALQQLVQQLEKRKYAATDRPRAPRAEAPRGRRIPAQVRRAVRERDGDRCTFVGDNGHRCESRTRLEFDHVQPYALGGTATVEGIRLRCRTHNQYEADRVFGASFMDVKRGWRSSRTGNEAHAGP